MQSEKTKPLIPVPAFAYALIDIRFDIAQEVEEVVTANSIMGIYSRALPSVIQQQAKHEIIQAGYSNKFVIPFKFSITSRRFSGLSASKSSTHSPRACQKNL